MSNHARKPGRRLVVADWEAKKRLDLTVYLDLGEAGEIEIEPPIFWNRKLDAARTAGVKLADNEAFIRVILGDDQVERWLSTGRTIAELDAAFTEANGMAVGEFAASSKH